MPHLQPLVSILINNYNYGAFLAAAIESALAQTYPHTEVIVVDDGSSDQSAEVMQRYGDRIIPIFKPNGGQASAINVGFAASQGSWICILDSDDEWLPNKVEQVVDQSRVYRQASVIYHRVQSMNPDATPLGQPWPPYPVIRGNIATVVRQTGGWWPFPPSTGLSFSRQFLSQVMPIPEVDYRICADTYLADLAPFFGDVIGVEQALSRFRMHGANNWSTETNLKRRSLEYFQIRTRHVNRVIHETLCHPPIHLNDHLPYQRLLYDLGLERNRQRISRLMLQNPWELRLPSRLKMAGQLWLKPIRPSLSPLSSQS
jgi:glycosyltransferase involved in cell wall biosynthesis